MKVRMCLCCVVMALPFAFPALAWAQRDVIPKGNEELYGTWANERSAADLLHGQEVTVSAEEMRVFVKLGDKTPGMVITWERTANLLEAGRFHPAFYPRVIERKAHSTGSCTEWTTESRPSWLSSSEHGDIVVPRRGAGHHRESRVRPVSRGTAKESPWEK